MKKLISLLLAALLVCALLLPAGAKTILPPLPLVVNEYGYTYTVAEHEDGNELTDVRYVGPLIVEIGADPAIVHVPKTLGNLPVTAENFTGAVFKDSPEIREFRIDKDHAQFCIDDHGFLFSKDGKTLVSIPNQRVQGIVHIPDDTEALGPCSILTKNPPVKDEKSVCLVIPASVTAIDENFADGKAPVLAGEAGSAAQSFAEENGLPFVLLGEGHTHTYFRIQDDASCTAPGEIWAECPCGAVADFGNTGVIETIPPLGHDWLEHTVEKENGKEYIEIYCTRCGEVRSSTPANTDDCGCRCHKINRTWSISLTKDNWKDVFQNLIFRFKLAFWHLSGTHQYCECGARHF